MCYRYAWSNGNEQKKSDEILEENNLVSKHVFQDITSLFSEVFLYLKNEVKRNILALLKALS